MTRRHAAMTEVTPLAACIVASALAVAFVVRIGVAGPTRQWLAFPFAGVERTASSAACIFVSNASMLLGVVAGAALIQSRWCITSRGDRSALGVLTVSLLDTL